MMGNCPVVIHLLSLCLITSQTHKPPIIFRGLIIAWGVRAAQKEVVSRSFVVIVDGILRLAAFLNMNDELLWGFSHKSCFSLSFIGECELKSSLGRSTMICYLNTHRQGFSLLELTAKAELSVILAWTFSFLMRATVVPTCNCQRLLSS